MLRKTALVLLLALFLLGTGCQSQPAPEGGSSMTLQITSSAFSEGGNIPQKYTCDGEDASPPLAWSGVPAGTQSLALIADDPDAPVGTWVHWVLYNIPPDLPGLPEGIAKTASVEGTGQQGNNGFRKAGYGGPCPPKGKPHRYFFKLYALDTVLGLEAGASKADLEKAMQGHILAQGQLMGLYGR
ncbi:MAG: YbhB/YbcL family Raf kinase inhibitor-like protein [Chloroflexota bacterium]